MNFKIKTDYTFTVHTLDACFSRHDLFLAALSKEEYIDYLDTMQKFSEWQDRINKLKEGLN